MDILSQQRAVSNTATLANAVELSQCIIQKVMGDDISNCINGELVKSQDVADTIAAHLQKNFSKYMGE